MTGSGVTQSENLRRNNVSRHPPGRAIAPASVTVTRSADAMLLPPDENPVVGRAAIQVSRDWAYVRGRNTGTMRPLRGDGPERWLNDIFLMILCRDADRRGR